MNDKNMRKLMWELEKEGASKDQAEELYFLSKNLSNLFNFERSEIQKNRFLTNRDFTQKTVYISKKVFLSVLFSFVLLLGFASLVSAQSSFPGDPLYPVKLISENAVASLDPSFENEILKRKSEEIKALSTKIQNSNFKKIIDDYEKDLKDNEKLNFQTVVESGKNLKEAAENLKDGNKKEIENAIQETQKAKEQLKNSLKSENGSFDQSKNQNTQDKINITGSDLNNGVNKVIPLER